MKSMRSEIISFQILFYCMYMNYVSVINFQIYTVHYISLSKCLNIVFSTVVIFWEKKSLNLLQNEFLNCFQITLLPFVAGITIQWCTTALIKMIYLIIILIAP